jgi:alkyl hydroperoxide reductase subunit AhpC
MNNMNIIKDLNKKLLQKEITPFFVNLNHKLFDTKLKINIINDTKHTFSKKVIFYDPFNKDVRNGLMVINERNQVKSISLASEKTIVNATKINKLVEFVK